MVMCIISGMDSQAPADLRTAAAILPVDIICDCVCLCVTCVYIYIYIYIHTYIYI